MWLPATVTNVCDDPRSYIIKCDDGGEYRRNRRDIRLNKQSENVESQNHGNTEKQENENADGSGSIQDDSKCNGGLRRSDRVKVCPDRLTYYEKGQCI